MTQFNQAESAQQREADAVERHRRRLLEIYQPQTSREEMIIAELARVYHEKEEFELDHKIWMQFEADQAPGTFKRQEADDFLKLQRQWPKAPAAIAPVIGQSINGALWLVEIWQIIVARLAPKAVGPVPGMDQACQALLAMGFSDKIQYLSEAGWWWATRFLAIQADQDAAIKAWLRKSGPCDKATELQQARHKLYDAPDPARARQELYDEAVRQAALWQEKLKELQRAQPARQQAQLSQARCMGLKTPGLASYLNNSFKLRDSIHKCIKFFEDRLAKIPKERAADERYHKRMSKMEKLMPSFFPPEPSEPEPVPPICGVLPEPPKTSDQGQTLETPLSTELLPKMAAAVKPQPAKTYVAHAAEPQPAQRPMSNRKKRLIKMAAREHALKAADSALRDY